MYTKRLRSKIRDPFVVDVPNADQSEIENLSSNVERARRDNFDKESDISSSSNESE